MDFDVRHLELIVQYALIPLKIMAPFLMFYLAVRIITIPFRRAKRGSNEIVNSKISQATVSRLRVQREANTTRLQSRGHQMSNDRNTLRIH